MSKLRREAFGKIRSILLLLYCLGGGALRAADTLQLTKAPMRLDLRPFAELYVDSTGEQSIQELLRLSPDFTETFDLWQNNPFPEAYWLRIPVKSEITLDARIVVPGDSLQDIIQYPVDHFHLFVVNDEGKIVRTEKSGYLTPKSEKSLPFHAFVTAVPVTFQAGDHVDLYLRLRGASLPQKLWLGLELRAPEVGVPHPDLSNRWVILGPWGMFLIIGLFVLVLYFYLRDKAFLFFGIFCLFYSHNLLSIEPAGGFINLIGEHPTWRYPLFCVSLFSILFLLLFGNAFINIKKHFPSWYRYFLGALAIIVMVLLYYLVTSFWEPYVNYHTWLVISLLLLIPFCIRFIWSKKWTARVFAIGIFCFLGGNGLGVIFMIMGYDWGPIVWMAGQLILLFLFALALANRLMESERQQITAEKIKELDLMKSRFFTNITHEFRTPLSMILGPLQTAEESVPFSEIQKADNEIPVKAGHISLMKRSVLRLQQLVDQILDISKIESGKMKLQLVKGGIVKFIRTRVGAFKDIAAGKNIHLVACYPTEKEQAVFDPDKMEKILTNILSNAIKFTPEKGEIRIEAEMDNQYLKMKVADSGPGMKKEELEHIFNRFYQSDQAAQQGTGVGMALVKELIDLLKGHISVESQPGKGTTVSWKICINADSFDSNEIIPSADPTQENEGWRGHYTQESSGQVANSPAAKENVILVVEDDVDLQSFIREILSDEFLVLTANNGQEGIDVAIRELPDLIVSDIMMPGMSGFDMSATLKNAEKTSHIPILLLTAKTERKNKLKGLMTGANDYLTKPFDAKELKLKIVNLIRLRDQLKEKYGQQPWNLDQQKISSMEEQFLQKVIAAIRDNLSNEYFSVEELGGAVGYSRSQLFRKLKAIVGKSPLDLIKEYRLYYAKELLEKKAANVSEAAHQVGYSSLSYFSQSFKKEFGILPSEV